jgi:YD repeat-containing protein
MIRHRLINCFVIFGLFVSVGAGCALAQDPDDTQNGIKAYGTYRGGDIDSVSMTNGNLVLHIPLLSYPQRGKVHLSYSLIYSHKIDSRQKTICTPDNGCNPYIELYTVIPPDVHVAQDQGFSLQDVASQNGSYTIYSLLAPDGASHPLAPTNGTNYESLDATGLQAYLPTSGTTYVTDAEGTRYSTTTTGSTQEDTNGNQVTETSGGSVLDTVGRTIPAIPTGGSGGTCPTGPLPVSASAQWVVPGPNGTSTFVLCWAKVTVYTAYFPNTGWITAAENYLQSLVLPNGTAWTFQYSNDFNGDLTQITFPTGGTISYVWGDGYSCAGGPVPPRWLASRTVNANDGTGNHIWTYSGATTVTDPLGNNTVYTNTSFGTCSSYTTAIQYYQGAVQPANLIKTVSTTYSSATNPFGGSGGGPGINVVPTQVTTTWATNGKTSQVTKTYDSGFTFALYPGSGNNYTGIYGKVIAQKEYDYGTTSGQPGPLLRQTNTSYAWQSPNPNHANYLGNNMLNLVYSSQITDGTNQKALTQYGHDETTPVTAPGIGAAQNLDLTPWTGNYRGNRTSVNRWLNLPTVQTVKSSTTYYNTGMPSVSTDPLQHQTTYFYSSTFQGAYVTQVQNALTPPQSIYYNYDYYTGLKTSTTDLNQLVTSYSYDSMERLLQANHPDNGQDTVTRQETSPPFTATLTSTINTAQNKIPLSVFDGLGRVGQTQLTSDPQGIDFIDTTYDGLGRVASVSNPYRDGTDATSSPGTTTYTYDALGRKTKESYPDGSSLTTAYCGPNTLVTDPTGKWRRSRVNGLGQLVEVDEPNAIGATVASTGCPGMGEPIWVTSYTNDLLGNLTQVVQNGSHTRTFTYDSLSRLLTSANPETGTITYTYNADNTVATKKDARSITASYTYDAIHRETGVSYSNGDPSLTFTYDQANCLNLPACQNVGYRTSMTDGAGSESWAYQVDKTHSRSIHQEQRTTNSSPNNITKTTTYYLDLAGNVTQIVYPTGRTVNYTHDSADRPSSATDASNGITYVADWKTPPANTNCTAGAVCYTPQGTVYGMSIGQSSSFTGFNISETFNNRLEPNEIKASSSAGNAIDITYNFVDPVSTHNAGHVYGIANNLNSSRSQTFTYDQVNRILSAGTTATTGTYCW